MSEKTATVSAQPRPEVNFLAATRAVYALSFRMTLFSKRTLLMGLLGGFMPLAAMIFLLVKQIPAAEIRLPGYIFYTNSFQFVYLYVMMVALFYGIAVVAEEVDWKTITYLFVRPVSKGAILLGKGAVAWTIGALILFPVIGITYTLFTLGDGLLASGNAGSFFTNFPTFIGDVLRVLGSLAVYTAVFVFLGVRFNRPVLWGMGFAFLWESWVAFVPGLTRKLTVMHYVQSLSPHASGRSLAVSLLGQATSTLQSVFALLVIFALFAALSLWVFRRKEYFFNVSN